MASIKKTPEALVAEQAEAPAPVVEETLIEEAPVADLKPELPTSVRAGAGDSYLTIAIQLIGDGPGTRDFAKAIQQANNFSPVSYGMKVFIP